MGTCSLPYHRARAVPRRHEKWTTRLSVLLTFTGQCIARDSMRRYADICTLCLMLMAWQCFSDYPEACAIQGRPETRGDQFFAEAKRLWESQQGANSLANCGALCMMAIMWE